MNCIRNTLQVYYAAHKINQRVWKLTANYIWIKTIPTQCWKKDNSGDLVMWLKGERHPELKLKGIFNDSNNIFYDMNQQM